MSANSFGSRFVVTSFGESHGRALGVIIDGCPAGLTFDLNLIELQMKRRRPGPSKQIVSLRAESDQIEVLSGIFENKTLGTPIAIICRNQDARSADYDEVKKQSRAGHADDVWLSKFSHTDHRGGGRSSGRETVSRVMAGSVAQMLVKHLYPEIKVIGYASQIGSFELSEEEKSQILEKDIDSFQARFPSAKQDQVAAMLMHAQETGESFGGSAEILIHTPPSNLGQPVFRKLKSDLAQAYLSVGATNGFELGAGFLATEIKGTDFHVVNAVNQSGQYGGVRGGISTGEDIISRVSFKPTSSILDIAKKGRHDPCIVTRAIPVLEAMTWLVLAEHILWARTDRV